MSSAARIHPASGPPVSADQLRRVCARFATGVVVVTAVSDAGQPLGVTVNSVASVSADPPIVMVCLDCRSTFLKYVAIGREIVFNILGEHQQSLSNRFACRDRSFDGVHWSVAPGGSAPALQDAIADLRGCVREILAMGDHAIVFVDVLEARHHQGRPLLFIDSHYARVAD